MCSHNKSDTSGNVEKYLKLILKIFKNRLGLTPNSIILFGSAAKGGLTSRISDVDFLIVLDDRVASSAIRAAVSFMFTLQKYFFKSDDSSSLSRLLYFFEAGTGMFKSFFICFERDLLSTCFHRIFDVNRFLSWFMVPSKLVLNSIFSHSRVVYGKNYDFKNFIRETTFFQIVKSFILCSFLYLFFIIVNCFKPVRRYLYESVKWSLLNCHFYLTGRSVKVKDTVSFFKKILDNPVLEKIASYNIDLSDFNVKDYFKLFNLIFNLHFKAPRLFYKKYSKRV